jgi:hypothetical protein
MGVRRMDRAVALSAHVSKLYRETRNTAHAAIGYVSGGVGPKWAKCDSCDILTW